MLMHKSFLLLVLPILFTLPAGIAKANDLDIQTGTMRVTIDHNNGIRIESANRGTLFVPSRGPMSSASWSRVPSHVPIPPTVSTHPSTNIYRSQPLSPSRCTGQTEQSNQSSRSNGGISQTYSSMSTSVCH
jgi:hypothetical protein